MRISASAYSAFWANPERYRLSRVVSPADTPSPLRLGQGFHAVVEAASTGWDAPMIAGMLSGAGTTPSGETLKLSYSESQDVQEWFAAWNSQLPKLAVLRTEAWFSTPLPQGHSLHGRIDALVQANGGVWVHEIKTARYVNEDNVAAEYARRMQLRTECLGAHAILGHAPEGVVLDVIGKTGKHPCHRVELRFSAEELAAIRDDLALTCQLIESLEGAAPDGPWPHPALSWPCSRPGACEYEAVCGRPGVPDADGLCWVQTRHPFGEKGNECLATNSLPER